MAGFPEPRLLVVTKGPFFEQLADGIAALVPSVTVVAVVLDVLACYLR